MQNPGTGDGRNLNGGGVKKRLVNYVLVCREWQAYFERRTFNRLTLSRECLMGLVGIGLQTTLFRHIWFRVQLMDYRCFKCLVAEDHQEVATNTLTTQLSIEHLFRSLVVNARV